MMGLGLAAASHWSPVLRHGVGMNVGKLIPVNSEIKIRYISTADSSPPWSNGQVRFVPQEGHHSEAQDG